MTTFSHYSQTRTILIITTHKLFLNDYYFSPQVKNNVTIIFLTRNALAKRKPFIIYTIVYILDLYSWLWQP